MIDTPEGIELQLLLAGAASRSIAGVLDLAPGTADRATLLALAGAGGPGGGHCGWRRCSSSSCS